MKSLVRWGLALSLFGGGMIAAPVLQPPAAIAMTEAEALKRLESVPVFAITNQQGIPILASVPNPKDKSKQIQVATFFLSQQDALSLVSNLKSQKPDVGKDAKVVPLSLRQAYEIKTKNKDKAATLAFDFIPQKAQVDAALAILKQDGKEVKQFNDVPLFFAVGGAEKGILTLEQGKEKIIPFYFNKQDLQGMLDEAKKRNAQLASSTKIQVTSLSQVMDSLLKDKSQTANQITLVPDRGALQYAIQQQGGQKPGAAPAAGGQKPGAPAQTQQAKPKAK
jgi:nickel transport protein